MKLSYMTQVDLPDSLDDFQAAELKIREAMFLSGQKLLVMLFEAYEQIALARRDFWVKDRQEKTFQTLVGEVRYRRVRLLNCKTQKTFYPLDQWLDLIPKQKTSLGLEKAIVTAAVQRSYRQGNAEIEQWTGVARTTMSNWNLVQSVSKREQQKEEFSKPVFDWHRKPLPHIPFEIQNPCPILGMDPDGTYCKNQDGEAKDHDIKIAVLYTGKKAQDKKGKRLALQEKQVLMSRTTESIQDFFNRVTQTAMTCYGANPKTKVVIHGDGDQWIKGLKYDYWDKALIRLDPWHLKKKIYQATNVDNIPPEWEQNIYGNPDGLMLQLQTYKVQKTAPRSKEREKMKELINYIKNNRDGLLPSGISKETKEKYKGMFKRGSGTIESNVGHAFGARFKLPRMSWSAKGLDNLVYLREKYLNRDMKPKFKIPQPLTKEKVSQAMRNRLH